MLSAEHGHRHLREKLKYVENYDRLLLKCLSNVLSCIMLQTNELTKDASVVHNDLTASQKEHTQKSEATRTGSRENGWCSLFQV